MSGFAPDFKRLQTQTNQAFVLGNKSPPDMKQVNEDLLKAASPRSFNLTQTTRTDQSLSEAAARRCRQFQGFGGLRRLQDLQAEKTALEPGCGWMYQQQEGVLNPPINRGAFGDLNRPFYGGSEEPDEVTGQTMYEADLDAAEKKISNTFASRLGQSCEKLANLTSDNKEYFGFCKTTGRIIPIETKSGSVRARYPKDQQLGCPQDQIVPAKESPAGCPTKEGFQGKGVRGNVETFISGAAGCQLPLTKSCLIQFAREAGCSDNGSLIQALKVAKSDPYDATLRQQGAYSYYTAKGKLTPSMLRDGSVASKQVAIEELNRLAKQANETPSEANKGSAAAARDLCLKSGYFLEKFDFCTEITPETRINTENFKCVQKQWRQAGGDSRGFLFPKQEFWSGKTFTQLAEFIRKLQDEMKSKDKSVQANAIRNFIGTESYAEYEVGGLEREPGLIGSEVIWIYYENWNTEGAVPIIMRCDTLMGKNVGSQIIPHVNNDLIPKYLMPSNEGVAFMSAFEIRPDADTSTSFRVYTDDGFTLAKNQMPGQGISNNTDFNTFIYQGPTWHQSLPYQISADSKKEARNTITMKWFQGPGGATFALQREGRTIVDSPLNTRDMYLTQEPLAPWLQYEICSRPNLGRSATVGFFEKRWNGPCAFPWQNGTKWKLQDQNPVPSFDCEWSQTSFLTDSRLLGDSPTRGFMSFTNNSWWRTKASFAFNSMKTMTLLVRPRPTLTAGAMGSIMWWPGYYRGWSSIGMETPGLWLYSPDGKTHQFDFWIGNRGHSYMDCVLNEWNLIVIQMIGDKGGLRKFSCAAAPVSTLRTKSGRSAFVSNLREGQAATGQYIIPRISNPNEKGFSGPLILGGGNAEGTSIQRYSFTGDIGWLHGFNHYLDEELLDAEVNQTWRSRWPVPPLDTPDKLRRKVLGNNGTVSCETYCRGTQGAPWNNELPASWNGSRCVSTNLPDVDCYTVPNRPIECVCEKKDCSQGFENPAPAPAPFASPAASNESLISKFKW